MKSILKIEAIEFAVKYDDGKDPRGLAKADIILIGYLGLLKLLTCI